MVLVVDLVAVFGCLMVYCVFAPGFLGFPGWCGISVCLFVGVLGCLGWLVSWRLVFCFDGCCDWRFCDLSWLARFIALDC